MKVNGIRISPARARVLLWCARTGVTVYWPQGGHGWTEDDYGWPVPLSTIQGLFDAGMLELHPEQLNHGKRYRVPPHIAVKVVVATPC